MNRSFLSIAVGVMVGAAAAGCFSKPGFSGGDDASKDASGDGATDGAGDASPDAPYVEPACAQGLSPLPDNIKLRTEQFSIDDVDRNAFDDIALVGEDNGGGQHVFIYFGQRDRDIDLNCWDHEIIATDFKKIGGVKLEHGWYGGDGTKGTLFVFGQDFGDVAKIRLEARNVDTSQNFTDADFRVGPAPAPQWTNEATAHSAFLVWRNIGNDQEIFFGGDNRVFTLPISTAGMGATITSVANPGNVKIAQALDVNGSEVLIDDGRNFFNITRTSPADQLSLPSAGRLPPLDTGAVSGEVFATQEWAYRFINEPTPISYGIRVPRITTGVPTTLQMVGRHETFNKVLQGNPTAIIGPFMTGGTMAHNVGMLGNTLAAVVTTFTPGGLPATNGLAIEANASFTSTTFAPSQKIRLHAGAIPVVFAGNFRSVDSSNIVVLYPRRKLSDSRTRSVCYEALIHAGMACLSECGASVCAQ